MCRFVDLAHLKLFFCPLDPTHQRANGNLKYFEYQLAKQKKVEKVEEKEEESKVRQRRESKDDYLPERKKYEQLCRGQGIKLVRRAKQAHLGESFIGVTSTSASCQTPRRQSRLFCRYYDNNRHPRYVIGPVQQEDEWDSPHIVRYHNIVSEKDMEKVKELAKPRVSPSIFISRAAAELILGRTPLVLYQCKGRG